MLAHIFCNSYYVCYICHYAWCSAHTMTLDYPANSTTCANLLCIAYWMCVCVCLGMHDD